MVKAHPLVGVGLGNFNELMPRYADPGVTHENIAHNSYLEVAAEMGIPQCMIFLAMLFFSYRSFSQVRRKVQQSGPKLVYETALGLQAGLLGHAVAALTFSAEYQKLFWLVLYLSMCLPALVRDMALVDERPAVRARGLLFRGTGRQPAIGPSWKTRPASRSLTPGEGPPGSNAEQPGARRGSSGSAIDTLARFSERARR